MIINKKRLVVEIDDATHSTIKSHVALRNMTLRQWVLKVIIEALKKESLQQYH